MACFYICLIFPPNFKLIFLIILCVNKLDVFEFTAHSVSREYNSNYWFMGVNFYNMIRQKCKLKMQSHIFVVVNSSYTCLWTLCRLHVSLFSPVFIFVLCLVLISSFDYSWQKQSLSKLKVWLPAAGISGLCLLSSSVNLPNPTWTSGRFKHLATLADFYTGFVPWIYPFCCSLGRKNFLFSVDTQADLKKVRLISCFCLKNLKKKCSV